MPDPKVYKANLTDLIPDKQNANRGTQRGQKMIQESLRQDGAARSIVVDAHNNVVAGNKTLENAVDIGLEQAVVVEVTGNELVVTKRVDWDLYQDESPRRYAWRDNQAALVSIDFDPELLAAEIAAGIDFTGIFTEQEQAAILAELKQEPPEDTGPQVDKAEQLQEKWQCQPGQLWQIESQANPGQYHRLICGDCRDKATVKRLTQGRPINGVFTSPPYAMQRAKQYGGVETDQYVDWWEAVQDNARGVLADDGSFFVNIKPASENYERQLYVFDLVLAMKRKWDWRFIEEFSWNQVGIPGDPKKMGKFKNQFEPIYQFSISSKFRFNPDNVRHESDNAIIDDNYQPGYGQNFQGLGINPFSVRQTGKGFAYPGNVVHAHTNEAFGQEATFPLKLPTFFIRAYSDPLDIWLDPFCGSGTVGVAAENEGRLSLMIEQLPKYCAVILERFATTFGIEPELTG